MLTMPRTTHRVGDCAKSRTNNNVPQLAIPHAFRYTEMVMVMSARRREQRQRYLKANVALALYRKYGRVPKEDEIDHAYHVTLVLYTALPGISFFRARRTRTNQLALF